MESIFRVKTLCTKGKLAPSYNTTHPTSTHHPTSTGRTTYTRQPAAHDDTCLKSRPTTHLSLVPTRFTTNTLHQYHSPIQVSTNYTVCNCSPALLSANQEDATGKEKNPAILHSPPPPPQEFLWISNGASPSHDCIPPPSLPPLPRFLTPSPFSGNPFQQQPTFSVP